MKWMWGGALCSVLALGGCAHEESSMQESATPVALNESADQSQAMDQSALNQTWRQPVAGHESTEGAVLHTKGKYQVKKGEYRSPQGEYFQPQGIYGTKGKLITQGEVLQQGSYGTFVKPEGTLQRPTGIEAQPEGTFYRPFNGQMSERQPVAGRDQAGAFLFVKDDSGKTWQVSDPAVIQRVQQKLSDQGCSAGSEGKADQKFGQALLQCQQKLSVPATGVIDRATARALGVDFDSLRPHRMPQQ